MGTAFIDYYVGNYTTNDTTLSSTSASNVEYDTYVKLDYDEAIRKMRSKIEKMPSIEMKSESKFVIDLINNISNSFGFGKKVQIGIFCKYKSDLDEDIRNGLISSRYYYVVYPIESDPQRHEKICLFAYDIGIIIGVLEYLPSKMLQANLIKEAIVSLSKDYRKPLIIIAKSKEEVEEIKKVDPNIVTGFDVEELKSLALFAGAKEIIRSESIENNQCIIVTNC